MQQVRGQRGPRLWVVALAVAIVAVAAGFVVREVYRQPPTRTTVQEIPPQPSTPVRPEDQPGDGQVKATQDAAEHPVANAIWPVLQAHFDSINKKDYDKWRTTVTRARAAGFERNAWQSDYKTTKDGSILMHRIDTAPDRKIRVLISFTSTQAIDDAPPELPEPCIRWHIVLPLTKEDNKWKIDVGTEGASPRHEKCGADTANK
ncbi:hypothetical protein [Kibdelosporangium aridum]|uniref:hypothetical protein n=1 Tax=Kibdelosporangium aridum TaxID=2030 RepID=UPI001179CAAF|nr:hypothetical protein [Kibdelosporangium aridum]